MMTCEKVVVYLQVALSGKYDIHIQVNGDSSGRGMKGE